MRRFTQLALCAFLLAAITGVLLRFGLFLGMPAWAQNFGAIRHAHSHLMYFGWATLAIMAMIWRLLPRWLETPLPHLVPWQMGATAVMAFLSFPAFWSNGYGLTQVGTAEVPLGAMVAGLNGLTWIFFAILYIRATARMAVRPHPVQLWDWAIVMLLLAVAGALGLVVMVVLEVANSFLQQAMLHLFLELFATGWFTIALLGLLWAWVGQQQTLPSRLPTQSLALLTAPAFLLGVNPALVPDFTFWISAAANFGAALLLAWHLRALWRQRAALPMLARFGLLALSIHVVIAVALLCPGLWQWSAGTQLRVFYLHNLLLGWVSSTLLGLAIALWFSQSRLQQQWLRGAWYCSVGCMLLALLGMGLNIVVPVVAVGTWLRLAAWSSAVIAGTLGSFVLRAILCRAGRDNELTFQPAVAKALLSELS